MPGMRSSSEGASGSHSLPVGVRPGWVGSSEALPAPAPAPAPLPAPEPLPDPPVSRSPVTPPKPERAAGSRGASPARRLYARSYGSGRGNGSGPGSCTAWSRAPVTDRPLAAPPRSMRRHAPPAPAAPPGT
jgi:hypothetical protein